MVRKIDHIGIAVKSLDEVKQFFKIIFNLEPHFEEIVTEQKVRVIGYKIGESNLEFLQPTQDDSPISKYLEKRGEGIHHLALSVEDIKGMLDLMSNSDIKLIDPIPRIGAEGKKIAFVHPKRTFGILLELSQEKLEQDQ